MEPQLRDIEQARNRLQGVIHPSPLIHSPYFSHASGAEVFLKLENLQETGSFKVRGAYNRIRAMTAGERQKGVIAASAGNHAQGVAWASKRLGIHATIVMPETVSIRKLLSVKEYGAEVVLLGAHLSDALARAEEIARESGKTFIAPFDDPLVVAGQGTIALELSPIIEGDCAIVVPIGGGGLISGVAIAAKHLAPKVRIIGVQTESCPSAIQSLEKGTPSAVPVGPTLADGVAVAKPSDLTFSIMRELVDEVVAVDEEAIAGAIMNLLDRANIVAEGAGAVPLAALTEERISITAKRYVLVVSGGNIELNTIDRILQRGSIKMGRLIRIEVNLLDAPGSLWKLMGIIAEEKANILNIFHDRLNLQNPIQVSRVNLSLETRGHDHARELMRKLQNAGYDVKQAF
jgi:threonine dehydratase